MESRGFGFDRNESQEDLTLRWKNILQSYLEEAGYRKQPTPRVLDAGCYIFREYDAVVQYFGKESVVVGVDKDQDAIQKARERIGNGAVSLLVSDIAQMPVAFDDYFDVVIVREPNVHEEENWKNNYRRVFQMLRPNGFVLGTSYLGAEISYTAKFLSNSGCKIIINKENKFRGERTEDGCECCGVDGNVLVAQKVPST